MALVVDVEAIHSWLTARLDEDEQHADQIHDVGCARVLDGALNRSCDCGVPEQTRRDIEAKRQILEIHLVDGHWCPMGDAIFRALALPYSDRDDFPAELRLL